MNSETGQRNVVVLGLVSMLNDTASEMIYPIVPIFLTKFLGAPASIVGLIEGIAEATASVLKVFSGWLSDRFRHRKRFVGAGYTLSAVSKLILAAAGLWLQVLLARFIDRLGKGTRTSARDALIADSVQSKNRGAAFGLHRGLDTAGAVFGPLLALLLLHFLGESFSIIFLLAAIPGLIGVVLLIVMLKEPKPAFQSSPLSLRFSLKQLSPPFKVFLFINIIFALGNSSDAFLILRAQSVGYSTINTVFLFIAFNFTYSILSFPFGKLSDRFSPKKIIIAAFFLFSMVYTGFALCKQISLLWLLFPLYGLYMAMSEGVGKAYISRIVPAEIRGTALGVFYTATGLVMFFASFMAGLLWEYVGIPAPFYLGAVLSSIAGSLFIGIRDKS